ncbi:MAG TPA: VWA domain-containing protein [Polyangiaceae bacterium]|nr:VWA domain-containing protein [Polyangiaceae bacterium]
MKFAVPVWLFGSTLALVVALALIVGGVLLSRSVKRFGDEALVRGLLTANPSGRRALKGVLLVLAVALAFIALAEPQYGRGTRLIPATNLDVVIVLDYSKSMYAKDISPSRILRAKSEVGRLIQELPGARFAAVAFAGEPMAFPLTSDGAAIAQFFRQLSPNDMPVGGTAIARALEAGRELLERDPKSKQHRRVMLLVTDGEDLEGDPVAVAESCKQADITVHVVQIGGRTPEPIPDVNEAGESHGYRTDEQGKPLTTSLSAEGEEQLSKIASSTGGVIVQSARGETGITEISRRLARLVTEELSEKVETVYADVYMYPLGLALLLVLVETFVNEAARSRKPSAVPPPKRTRRTGKKRLKKAATAASVGLLASLAFVAACGKTTDSLFERHAPAVDQAISAYDAGDAGSAVSLLEGYLATGKCENGEIGTPDPVRERPNASFDLGLGLFKLAERFGKRFGEEEPIGDAGPTSQQDADLAQRSKGVDCALRVVRLVAGDSTTAVEFRARAHYLAGNLEFLRRDYKAAVKEYDAALRLMPGVPEDGGDGIGRDAAYNRAIALRRIEDEENKKKDAEPPDAGNDGGQPDSGDQPDSGKDQDQDSGKKDDKQNDDKDKDKDKDKQPDAGQDAGAPKPENQPDGGNDQQQKKPQQPPPQSANQDDRMLDMLEHAPTMQEQDAKNRAIQGRTRSGMEDK